MGVPQLGQNLDPAGTEVPQLPQKELPPILAPHSKQNFDPAGTDAPQLGQAAVDWMEF